MDGSVPGKVFHSSNLGLAEQLLRPGDSSHCSTTTCFVTLDTSLPLCLPQQP